MKPSLATAFSARRLSKKAKGGEITSDNYMTGDEMCDTCGGAPCTCSAPQPSTKMYSEGGKVANAGGDPSRIDDLALRDDLEFSETGANSGDELGDDQEEKDRRDIVSRIMHSLAKKDKMPRPA